MNIAILIVLFLTLFFTFSILLLLILKDVFDVDMRVTFSRMNIFKKKNRGDLQQIMNFIGRLVSVLTRLSIDKVGALIVIEKNDNLNQYINIGSKVDAEFFPELIYSIFYNKKSPLHDGAIIVRNWKIISLSSYLPTSKKNVTVEYGARHRAAFGISEKYDCFAFVVSETNGNITGVHQDEIKKLSNTPEQLTNQIIKIFSSSGVLKNLKNSKNYGDLDSIKK